MHIPARQYMCTRAGAHAYTYKYTHIHAIPVQKYMCTHVGTHACAYTHTHTHMCACTHIHTHIWNVAGPIITVKASSTFFLAYWFIRNLPVWTLSMWGCAFADLCVSPCLPYPVHHCRLWDLRRLTNLHRHLEDSRKTRAPDKLTQLLVPLGCANEAKFRGTSPEGPINLALRDTLGSTALVFIYPWPPSHAGVAVESGSGFINLSLFFIIFYKPSCSVEITHTVKTCPLLLRAGSLQQCLLKWARDTSRSHVDKWFHRVKLAQKTLIQSK